MVRYDTVVTNGTVVTPEVVADLDVGIIDGEIAALSLPGSIESVDQVIDAAGLYVFPGFIDAHVHVKIPLGEFTTVDGFEGVSRAAAHGGTTTMIDFAIPDPNETSLEGFERKRNQGDELSHIDFGLHACITAVDEDTLRELPQLIERGASSVKMFMVYRDRLLLDNGEIHEAMQTIVDAGGLALVHAEDQDVIERLVEHKIAEDNAGYSNHPSTHPEVSESIAMWAIAELVADTGCPTYFVHASSPGAEHVLEYAREESLPLLAETCPHYLTLTQDVYDRADGERYVCSPPIRQQQTAEALWDMIDANLIQTINSDHCGYTTDQKAKFRDDITKIPNGLPGVETKNTVLFSEGVKTGKIPLTKFVTLASTNAAKMLGLYPEKGTISVGSDADLVLFDPGEKWTVQKDNLHMDSDYSPFEGFDITGRPHTVVSGGEIIVDDGAFVGDPGHGSFVETTADRTVDLFEGRLY